MSKSKKDYLAMQNSYYDEYASKWSLDFRDPVVGSYDAHNNWSDYDNFLFKDFDTNGLVALNMDADLGETWSSLQTDLLELTELIYLM